MRHLLTAAMLITLLGPTTPAHLRKGAPDKPCRVRKIYLAESGKSDEEERFRQELKKQLARKKFVLVALADEADGILAGQFSHTGSGRESKLAFESGELKDAQGERLWHGNFYFTRARAKDVA